MNNSGIKRRIFKYSDGIKHIFHIKSLHRIFLLAFLFVYLVAGLYTELLLIEKKPLSQFIMEDFGYYQRGLKDVLTGKDLYRIRDIGPGFLYPPPSLFVIELFNSFSPIFFRASVYIVFNISLLILMVFGIARRYGFTVYQTWYWYPLVLGFAPFLELLYIGQINMITQFGIFLMLYWELSFPISAGAGLSLGIITKVTPVIFFGYLLVNRRWKSAISAAISTVLLFTFGIIRYGLTPSITYISVFQELLNKFPLNTNSQSMLSKLSVLYSPTVQNYFSESFPAIQALIIKFQSILISKPEIVQRILIIYVAIILLISGVTAYLNKKSEPLFIITNLAMMLTPNIMWYHHYVFFLLPLFVWIACSKLNPWVVGWSCAGLLIIQLDRYQFTYGFFIHLFGHTSILLILLWQIRNLPIQNLKLSFSEKIRKILRLSFLGF
jgi:hypothetical protein